jgi:LysR family transcriptional regulator, transcriptional activator of the cysJI operon
MEYRLLQFARLADAGSFTKAAQELHLSQPALSIAMRKLERELGSELFVRGSHPLVLTPSGQAAYTSAKEMSMVSHNLSMELAHLADQKPALRVGMIDGVADTLFTDTDALTKLNEKMNLSLSVNNSGVLLDLLRHDSVDIAFVTGKPAHLSTHFNAVRVGVEPLMIVVHSSVLDSLRTSLQSHLFSPFLSYNRDSTTYTLIEQTLLAHDIRVEPYFYSSSPDIILKFVHAQQGAAILPYRLVLSALNAGELCCLQFDGLKLIDRPIYAVYRRGKDLSEPLQFLIGQVQSTLTSLYDQAQKLDIQDMTVS